MKILLIGSGGREHALAWKLAASRQVSQIYIAPGNPGTAEIGENVAIDVMDFTRIERFAKDKKIDLVVIGPEDPLAGGLVDRLQTAGLRVFGPSKEAAQLEADKWFAKEIMRQQAVPTADARSFTDADAASEYVRVHDGQVVIKASGLAKGKGVTVCYKLEHALEAIDRIMKKKEFGAAGSRVVIEERLNGPEVSVLAFVDGKTIYVMESAQDHKAIEDGDTGPMTGGMGAYTPTAVVNDSHLQLIEREILVPVVDGLARDGIPYKGVLYAGLMMTHGGPKVLEFNCRFGDPETQPLMMRLQSDLAAIMNAVVDGKLDEQTLRWDERPAISVVAASKGYPGKYQTGKEITGIKAADAMEGVKVFHSGTKMLDGKLVTDGGRVLSVSALGRTVAEAQKRVYEAISKIHFDGICYRRDIAHQAIR